MAYIGNRKVLQVLRVQQGEATLIEKEITANGTYPASDDEADGFSSVTVNVPIPEGYVKPEGTVNLNTNGEHDVSGKAKAVVNVPIPDGYIQPSGSVTITENGTYPVTDKEEVIVEVESSGGSTFSLIGNAVGILPPISTPSTMLNLTAFAMTSTATAEITT